MRRDVQAVEVAVRAVDVGYFNVKYTKGRTRVGDDNVIDVGLFPSLAPRMSDAAFRDSSAPQADVCGIEINGLIYAVGPGSANLVSGSEPRPIDPDYATTDKYHALTLGALHYMAESAGAGPEFVIGTLVLGLPLNTWHKYKDTLTDRFTGEHVVGSQGRDGARRITVRSVQVMVQPQGALVHFGSARSAADLEGSNLVVDPGGGTLDWFLANGQKPNWNRSGAYPKAMLHCAYAVADSINKGWRNQFEIVESIDAALRKGAPIFRVGPREHEMAPYRPAVEAVVEESLKAMLGTTGPLDAVRRIVLTGGGAGVFREYIVKAMPDLVPALEIDTDPVYANVKGFQVAGEVLGHHVG